MVTQPAYLKALKAYARDQFGARADVEKVVADIQAESDRGIVILAATGIEDILEWACLRRMPGLLLDVPARDQLFGTNGIASTFSSKIHLAYALGVIDKRGRNEIDLIREMRNACAHARGPMSFDLPQLQGVCLRVIEDFLPFLTSRKPRALREAFGAKCWMIQQYVVTGKRQTAVEAIQEAMNRPAIAS